jgi:hypothetical protein
VSADRVAAILAASPGHLDALQAAALAGPREGWIGAGFVRNAVWDALSGRAPDVAALADLDVVHHDPAAPPDAGYESALRAARGLPWSVVNQANAHGWNGHAPYRELADALAHWPETATAVAARLKGGRLEILAPHGLDDLLGLVLRPTPSHASDPVAVRKRLAAKGWTARWPALRVTGLDGH